MRIVEFHVKQPDQMRYKTVGDWYGEYEKETNTEKLVVETVDLGDTNMNCLVLLHEFVEAVLCMKDGITQDQVDEFDFENQDDQADDVELGELEEAPYHKQHMIADGFERIFCQLLGVDWNSYTEAIEKKYEEVDKEITEREQAAESAEAEREAEEEAKELAEEQIDDLQS